jgi:hypothetical protein
MDARGAIAESPDAWGVEEDASYDDGEYEDEDGQFLEEETDDDEEDSEGGGPRFTTIMQQASDDGDETASDEGGLGLFGNFS